MYSISISFAGSDSVPMANPFDKVEKMPPDAIFGVKELFKADADPSKVNLTVGAYATNEGDELVLNIVRETERELTADPLLTHSYLKITGDEEFINLSVRLILGENTPAVSEGRVAAVQTLSGTGALRVLGNLMTRLFPGISVYASNPTWGNHRAIFQTAGVGYEQYRYWDAENRCLDFQGMMEDISNAPSGSVILLHACAHNPTGVDPTQDQWKQICALVKEKQHIALFDSAYQGYATGDVEADAFAVRYFCNAGVTVMIAQSFSKNLGLYGERVGCASVVCSSAASAAAVKSHMGKIIRPMYSNPPRFGAAVVKRILGSPDKKARWKEELRGMADRIQEMRLALRRKLETEYQTPGDWQHVTSQIGMFCYTGMTEDEVRRVIEGHHVYLLGSGRISVAGLNTSNIDYVAAAFDSAIRGSGH